MERPVSPFGMVLPFSQLSIDFAFEIQCVPGPGFDHRSSALFLATTGRPVNVRMDMKPRPARHNTSSV